MLTFNVVYAFANDQVPLTNGTIEESPSQNSPTAAGTSDENSSLGKSPYESSSAGDQVPLTNGTIEESSP